MTTAGVVSEYPVIFQAEARGFERVAREAEATEQRVRRAGQRPGRRRPGQAQTQTPQTPQTPQAGRRGAALRQAGLGAGTDVTGALGARGLGSGVGRIAGAGFGAAGAAGAATAGIGLAVAGVIALGTAAANASVELGTVRGLELAQGMFELRQALTELFATIGDRLIPLVLPIIRGLTALADRLRIFIGDEDFGGQGRAATTFARTEDGGVAIAGRGVGAAAREAASQRRFEEGRDFLSSRIRRTDVAGNARDDGVAAALHEEFSARRAEQTPHENPVLRALGFPAPGPGLSTAQTRELRAVYENAPDFAGGGQAPGFQTGGIVAPRPGGILARVAEAGEAEAIFPLSELSRFLDGGGGRRGGAADVRQADALRFAMERSQDLPPLADLIRPPTPVTVEAGVDTGVPIEVLTQAEYDALTERDPGTLYAIKAA